MGVQPHIPDLFASCVLCFLPCCMPCVVPSNQFRISTTSSQDVKTAFRQVALQCHPDVNPSAAAAKRFLEACISSGISRIRFIHSSNQIPCSSNVCVVFSCLAILEIEGCLNSTL